MYRETREYLVSKPAVFMGCKEISHTSIENQGDEIKFQISSEHSKGSKDLKQLAIGYSIIEAEEIVVMLENCLHRAKMATPKKSDADI